MKSTIEVAKILKTTQRTILVTLNKYPNLRPQQRIGFNLLWSPAEIEAYRNRPRNKPGRKPKSA